MRDNDNDAEIKDSENKKQDFARNKDKSESNIPNGKLEYYKRNRSQLISEISIKLGKSKAPAISGLIAVLPIFAVSLVVLWLFNQINNIPGTELLNLTGFYIIDQTIKLGVILTFSAAIITGVGRLVRTPHGFKAEKAVDNIFDHLPFLGAIYNLVKITTETVLTGAEDLSEPIKVDFNGLRVTAFKTGNKSSDGRPIIFLPTAPNITTGLVIEIEPNKIVETEENAEEALTRTLSAGFGQKKYVEDKEDF